MGFEKGGASDEGVGTGGAALPAGGEIDAAVHLEAKGQAAFAAPSVEPHEFFQHVAAEGLPAEAGLHGHDEDEIDFPEIGLDRLGGRAGVENESVFATEPTDEREQGAVIEFRFDMETHELRAGFDEGFGVALRLGKHEMDIEEKPGDLRAQLGDHLRPEREIGDEMAIHDVEMEPGGVGGGDKGGTFGETGMLAGEDGGGKESGKRHGENVKNASA